MNNAAEKQGQQANTDRADAGAVEIKDSETGADANVGRTPGKAEGVDDPEADGNQ